MANRAPLILEILSASVRLASRAGGIVRDVLDSGHLGVVDKGINDLQTAADRNSQHCIIGSLLHRWPGLCVIGEEDYKPCDLDSAVVEKNLDDDAVLNCTVPSEYVNAGIGDITVWVDPLDGTAEFAAAKEKPELASHVTILIGIAVGKEPVAGVVHQPFFEQKSGRSVWGMRGVGIFNAQTHPQRSAGERVVVTTRSHPSADVTRCIEAVEATKVERIGGAGHKVLWVIEGRANVYLYASRGCKKWDTCAPEALLRSAGGDLTDVFGARLTYERTVQHMNSRGILASSNGESHQWYLDRVPEDIKEKLIAKEQESMV